MKKVLLIACIVLISVGVATRVLAISPNEIQDLSDIPLKEPRTYPKLLPKLLDDLAVAGTYENYLATHYANELNKYGYSAEEIIEKAKGHNEKFLKYGVDVVNNSIRVEMRVGEGPEFVLPLDMGTKLGKIEGVDSSTGLYKILIEAMVHLDKLPELAENPQILYVDLPMSALPAGYGGGSADAIASLLDIHPYSTYIRIILWTLGAGLLVILSLGIIKKIRTTRGAVLMQDQSSIKND